MNDPIADRMKQTGWTHQEVIAELEMMKAAAERSRTGNLTAQDRKQIAEGRRHFQPQGFKR